MRFFQRFQCFLGFRLGDWVLAVTQIMLGPPQNVTVRFEQLTYPVDVDVDACLLRQVIPEPFSCPDSEVVAIVRWVTSNRFFHGCNVRIRHLASASRLRLVGQSLDALSEKRSCHA